MKYLIQKRSKYIQKVKENNINEFFNALNDPNNNFFSTPIWKKIDQNPEFFQSIPTESFVENIVVLKNKNIRLLTSIINQRFMRISNAGQYYYNLKPIFDGFANGLEIKLQNITVDKLKLDILKEVVEALKKCSEHLENSRGGKPL
ncbi:hypothetical protein [Paenibacillus elgii]|uniref:hypothetical protein n=1 Tax=Paenibacillus elgii TaxID=189691 RepID=UPI000FDA6263|nr:hypothetical protein [Paenibacillus elgii]NEN81267.1 hypothetical protein [Paenibacillus elgii]